MSTTPPKEGAIKNGVSQMGKSAHEECFTGLIIEHDARAWE